MAITVKGKLLKIADLTDQYKFREAKRLMDLLDKNNLSGNLLKAYDINRLIIAAYIDTHNEIYMLAKELAWKYPEDDLFQAYRYIMQFEYLVQNADQYRAERIMDMIESRISVYGLGFLNQFNLSKAQYYADKGLYDLALLILEGFDLYDIPCPLIYLEIKTKVLIKLDEEDKLNQVTIDLEELIEGKELKEEKVETLNRIRLMIALYQNDRVTATRLVEELIDGYYEWEIPFSGVHMLIIQSMIELEFSPIEISSFTRSLELNSKSIPYLAEIEKIHQSIDVRSNFMVENLTEMTLKV